MTVLWRLIEKLALKFGLKKRGIFNKIPFYIKRSMEISGKGLLQFDQETSSLISNQTYHRTNMFSPYQPSFFYESDYECICIMINGKTCSVPLNILSSVESNVRALVLLNLLNSLRKRDKSLFPTRLINSIKHEHSCKILYETAKKFAGDHKAARNRQDSTIKTNMKHK